MTRCLIVPATLRDLTYIAANMRPDDKAEIAAQFPYWSPQWLGIVAHAAEWKWCATWDGEPIAAMGFSHLNVAVVQGWSWGTKNYRRAVPAMLRHVPAAETELIEAGVRRIEVRALASHLDANRLIHRMGGTCSAVLHQHGVGGESFLLYAKLLAGADDVPV
jgi:hypothetical protein